MKRITGKLSIHLKIFFITAFLLVSSVLITGAYVQKRSRVLYSESLDQAIQLIIQKNSSAITNYLQRTEVMGNMLTTEIPAFFPDIEYETDIFRNYQAFLSLQEKMNSFFEAIFGQDAACTAYLLLDHTFPMTDLFLAPDSHTFYDSSSGNDRSFYIYSDEAVQEEEWFQMAGTFPGSAYWFASPESSQNLLCASSMSDIFLVDGEAKAYSLGTLVIRVDISKIIEYDDGEAFLQEMQFFITDSERRVLYAKDSGISDEIFYAQVADSRELKTIRVEETEYRLWEQEMQNGMCLFILLPEYTFNRQIWNNSQTMLLVFLVVLVAGVIFAAVFSRMITRPIRRLSTHMEHSQAPTIISDPYTARDEIGILYDTYNEMVEKNEALIQQIYEYSEHQKKLRYQLLQAQINPHFLYNTLDSVSCAALLSGEEELSDVLSTLASLLRYNINQPDQLVTLEDELQMVEKYIAIQQFRCDNRIRMRYEIPEELMTIRLPKTILQPLVENSIFYGGTDAEGRYSIAIAAEAETDAGSDTGSRTMVSVRISNEPRATETTPEQDAAQLNDYLQGHCELKRQSSGLGIRNVQKRIQLVFGETYGIHYEPMEGKIAAIIRIPFFI